MSLWRVCECCLQSHRGVDIIVLGARIADGCLTSPLFTKKAVEDGVVARLKLEVQSLEEFNLLLGSIEERLAIFGQFPKCALCASDEHSVYLRFGNCCFALLVRANR